MKDISMKNCTKTQDSSKKVRVALVKTRPEKAVLKRAIEKSIKKNKETLKILAKR